MTRRTTVSMAVRAAAPVALISTWLVLGGVAIGEAGPGNRPATTPLQQAVMPGRWSAGGEPDDPQDGWPQPEPRPGLSEAQLSASIAAYAKQLYDADHFWGVVLAAHAGKVVMAQAYGLANVASNTPNTTATKFNVASLGKMFTTVAILQLAQAGKLSLDDTVRERLPDLPLAAADKISIRQLLDHRSGLGDFFGPRFEAAPPSRLRELSDFIPLFVDQPLAFAPGSSERYSNAGFLVLGLIVERISGEKYREYVAKHICAPAKMTSTGFWALDERVPDRATGYTRHGKDRMLSERIPNTELLSGRPESAGGAFATAADLLRFWDAVVADKLLSPTWTNWMFHHRFDVSRRPVSGGFGGAFDGVNAFIEMDPGWTVIALANLDPPSAQAVTRGAMEIIHGHLDAPSPGGKQGLRRFRPPATELADATAVPATMSGGRFTIEAKIDGKGPFRFAVDTGSTAMLTISKAAQQTLELEALGQGVDGGRRGAHPARRTLVRTGTVDIGGARFTDVNVTVGELQGGGDLTGVIGLGLFANLTVTLDYPKLEFRLSHRTVGPGDGQAVAFTTDYGVPAINIDVAGVAIKVDVDTSSPAMLRVPTALAAKLPLTGVGIRTAELRGELRVAGVAHASPEVDIDVQARNPSLGAQFLRHYAVTCDVVNHWMALAPEPRVVPPAPP